MLLRQRFGRWRQGRPFWGALLTVLAGLELYLSGRLQLGGLSLQLGFSGMQSTILPLALVVLGVLVMAQPVHHLFYGVIALIISVYCLVAVNLGGIVVGTLLGVAGGIVVVSWMGETTTAPAAPAPEPEPEPEDDPDIRSLLFDDGPERDALPRRAVGVAAAVALAAGGMLGGVPADGPCLLGFILCGPTTAPSPSPSASPGASASPTDGPSDSAAPAPAPGASPTPAPATTPKPSPSPSAPALTVPVPQDVPAPADSSLPVILGGNENVDVFAVPGDLKATDLQISGLKAVALVSVPVDGTSGKRRNALKIVADHVKVSGFDLTTYAGIDDRTAGTRTQASAVTMDGDATMYIASISASGPGGQSLQVNADAPPPTITSLLLALVNPTVGLLGATSDTQVWSGFHETVWSGTP
ncbi:MAG: DUF6114 domain-containing protein [Promicromonosporaceae bacterium]|nr:DUF6114 domain-containing protein [Promicromonosporaceae bacterium]